MKRINRWIGAILAAAALAAAPVVSTGAATATPAPTPARTPTDRERIESEVQLDVTVPLYVAMYAYGQTGKVVVPDPGTYCITNNTQDFEVEVTGVRGTNADMKLTDDIMLQKADELYLQLNNTVVTEKDTPVSWIVGEAGEDGGTSLPIDVGAKVGAYMNDYGTKKACSVQYTIKPIYAFYEVSFDLNVEELEEPDRTVDYGDVVPETFWVKKGETFRVPDMALDGYIFRYWVDAKKRSYEPGAMALPLEDTVLYARWDVDYASRLHVSSNYLETTAGASFNVVDWESGLDFELYNYEKTNVSLVAGDPLSYTVTANGSNAATGTLNGGRNVDRQTVKVHIDRNTGGAWTYGSDIAVSVTAKNDNGDQRVLTATFHLASREFATYSVTDNNDGTVTLLIDANDYAGNLTVNYGAAVVPDNTNDLMADWNGTSGTSGVIRIEKNHRYELLFFKTGTGTVMTTDGASAAEVNPTITLTQSQG